MAKIQTMDALKILNSRGEWTIEVRMTLDDNLAVSASLPQGVSRGQNEAVYLPPEQAISRIRDEIAPALRGLDPAEQEKIDQVLLELDSTPQKTRLGGNAVLGASLAAARAAATQAEIPLWQHLRNLSKLQVPRQNPLRLFINMIEGGAHSSGSLRFQEYLIIPQTPSFSVATETGKALRDRLTQYFTETGGAAATAVGDEGGFAASFKDDLEPFAVLSKIAETLNLPAELAFGLDAAAAQIQTTADKLFPIYESLFSQYKLHYLEDPFGEEDFANFAALRKRHGPHAIIAGDDLTTTNLGRMQKAREADSINGIIIKPNQIGTITETLAAVRQAKAWNWAVIASHRGGETDDDFIADLAYGIGADGLKLGGPDRGERIAKYNRLLAIEKSNRSEN